MMTVCRYMPVLGTDRAPSAVEGVSWKILEPSLLMAREFKLRESQPIA